MKILVIRFSSIGDIVLTTPVVRCLKKQMPGVEIHFLTKMQFAGILEPNPYIDKLHLLGNDLKDCIAQLKAENFDWVIDLHHNLRTLKVKRALGIQSRSFNKLNIEKWLLTALKINRLPAVHIVDRNLDTLSAFGVVNDGEGLDYFIPPDKAVRIEDIPMSHQAGYVALVIGAALNTKKMPADRLRALCGMIQYPIMLLGGPEDMEEGSFISDADPHHIYNACGKFSLAESADLVRRAKLVITHDTGLMHIAAAFKKPIISIWGNTVPAFGMSAYYGKHAVTHQVFEVTGLKCRPCSKIGYKKCPKGHFDCMVLQPLPDIAKAVNQMITKLIA